jgi:predicted AlkP superfamily phosphohydrolase/phosphomutase
MSHTRLVVLGFDAMDVELVRRWAAAGYLPTFRRLFESCAWTDYRHAPEITSGAIFPSIHTGLHPLHHGAHEEPRLIDGSYRLRLCNKDDIKGEPFWKFFADAGRRIVLADAPFASPNPDYGGKQYWGWGVHDAWLWRPSSVPRGLLASLSGQFGPHPVPVCHEYSTETDSLISFRSRLLTAIERRTAILRSLILSRDWDLFYGVFTEPHCAGHLMWHLEDDTHPRHSAEQLAAVGHALRDVYAAIDRALDELLASAGSDTTGAVFLSHGMGPNYNAQHLFGEFVARVIARWAGQDIATVGTPGRAENSGFERLWRSSVQRIPAAWRHRVRDHLSPSLRSRLYIKRIERARQWSRMPVFPLPMAGFAALRANLIGRDRKGRMRAGAEYTRWLDAIVAELDGLVNVESGEPVVDALFRADRRADPLTIGSFPDLLVWWSKSAPIRGIRSRSLGVMHGESQDPRTGEHVMRGLFLLSHPRARRGPHRIEGMCAMDIAPTLCDVAGVKPSQTSDGMSRRSALIAD